jgi:hypothetical protein
VNSKSAQVADEQEDLLNLLALAKWAISVFRPPVSTAHPFLHFQGT